MNINWALISFPFKDRRWQAKIAIGSALILAGTYLSVPLFWLLLPVSGYGLRIMRNSARGEQPSLPEWDNWGDLFVDGLKMAVVSIVYMLPVILLFFCVEAVWFGIGFGMPFMLRGTPRSEVGPFLATMFGVYGLSFVLFGLMFLLAIPLSVLATGAIIRLAATESVGKALEVREVWRMIKRGFKNYALATVVYLGVAVAAALIAQISVYTLVLCCVYPFLRVIAGFYLITEMGALFGLAYYHTENPEAAAESAPLKDTDPALKTDPLLAKPDKPAPAAYEASPPETPPVVLPAAPTDDEPPAPKKRRAPTPRKKKSTGEEEGS